MLLKTIVKKYVLNVVQDAQKVECSYPKPQVMSVLRHHIID